jgi:predicted RNase H-like nuclease (RuvC/YqgF family)
MSNVITEIKKLLGMEIKLEQMTLDNGTVIEAEIFEAGQPVFIVNGEDRVALPIGEYILDNGMILVVEVEGEIKEIREMAEEAPTEEAPVVEEEVEAAQSTAPKKVIESTVKESHFSQEEVDALKAEIETLKTELASMKNVEVKEVELTAQPLTHNPDAKTEVKLNLYSQSREMSTLDRVMNKIAN